MGLGTVILISLIGVAAAISIILTTVLYRPIGVHKRAGFSCVRAKKSPNTQTYISCFNDNKIVSRNGNFAIFVRDMKNNFINLDDNLEGSNVKDACSAHCNRFGFQYFGL